MREAISIAICILLFLCALQLGLIRTGLDYETVVKQMENLQAANDRLTEAIERLGGNPAGAAVKPLTAANPAVPVNSKKPPAVAKSVEKDEEPEVIGDEKALGEEALKKFKKNDGDAFDAGYAKPAGE